jgi:Helix-turn-helix domain
MPRKSPFLIALTDEDKSALERMARTYTSPYRDVVRARIVLYAAQGLENDAIAQRLDTPRQIVSKWRKRFFEIGMAGLEELPRQGRPGVFSPRYRRRRKGPRL